MPKSRRNWTTYNFAALWIGMAHCIPTYLLAGGLVAQGMNWWQALLTIEAQNTDKLAVYLNESRDRGIPVLPTDINESALKFSVEHGKGVRFGLTAIKGLGEGAVNTIIAARTELGGRIPSLQSHSCKPPRAFPAEQHLRMASP